ncbi:hypothetical protein [Candidatus Viridilinea mediisalina]|nr:hypothetical protein [Candidatus Viridilinea mediisalina]
MKFIFAEIILSQQNRFFKWAAMLERNGAMPPDATLAEFDPLLAPE